MPQAKHLLLLISLLAACDKTSPVMPTPPPPAAPAPVPTGPPPINGDKWNLTSTLTLIDRSAACGGQVTAPSLPYVYDMLLTVERAGASVHFVATGIDDPTEWTEFAATLSGTEFSGAGPTPLGYVLCGDVHSDHAEDLLSGRFASDGRTLTAEEKMVYRFGSGEVITYYFEWAATRQ